LATTSNVELGDFRVFLFPRGSWRKYFIRY